MPNQVVSLATRLAGLLTIVSMAALGLGVDIKVIGRTGSRVIAAVTLSLLFLLAISISL